MRFEIVLERRAMNDIAKAVDYYDEQQKGLGKKFAKEVDISFSALSKNPFYQIRYDDYRCLPLKRFPFMIHFIVDEAAKLVIVYAVIHTSLDPQTNWLIN
jgi:toxin ParE1/3/4